MVLPDSVTNEGLCVREYVMESPSGSVADTVTVIAVPSSRVTGSIGVMVGGLSGVKVVTVTLSENAPVPTVFFAATLNRYGVDGSNPVTVDVVPA